MPTKVYIWDFRDDSFGHASMTLSDGTHISWWPSSGSKRRGAGQSGFLSLLTLTFLTTARCSESLDEDIALEEERQPDSVFTLTNQIDEYAIRRWWMSHKNGTFFSGLFKNCCSVVFQGLREGSVLQFFPEQEKNKWQEIVVWHPKSLKDFLEHLSGHLSINYTKRNYAKDKHSYSSENKALERLNKLPDKKTEDVNESFAFSDNYRSMNKAKAGCSPSMEHEAWKRMKKIPEEQPIYSNGSVKPSCNNENMNHGNEGYCFSSEHETLKRMKEIPKNTPGYENQILECYDVHNGINHAKDIFSPEPEHETQKKIKGMPEKLFGSESESAERSYIHNNKIHSKDRHRSFSECETLERINKLYVRTPEDVNESFGYSDNHMSTNQAKERYSPSIQEETWPRMKKIPEDQSVCANGFLDRSDSSAIINHAKEIHSSSSERPTLERMNKLPENKPENLNRYLGCSDNHMSPRQTNERYIVPIELETWQWGKKKTEKLPEYANEVVERSHSSKKLNHAQENCSFSSGNEELKSMTKILVDDNELIECSDNHKDMNHANIKHSPTPEHETSKKKKEVLDKDYGYITNYVEVSDSHSDKSHLKDRHSSSPEWETQKMMNTVPGMKEGYVIESGGRPERKKSMHRSKHTCIPIPDHNAQRISKIPEKQTKNINQSLVLSDNHISTDQAKERHNPTSSHETRTSMNKLPSDQIGYKSTSVRPSDSSMNMNQTTNIYDGFREWEKPRKRRKKKPKRQQGCMNVSLGRADSDMSANHANDRYYLFQQNDNGSMQEVYIHESVENTDSQECKDHASNMYRIPPKVEIRQRKKGVTEKQPRDIMKSVEPSEKHTTMNCVNNARSNSNYRTVCIVLFTVVVVLVVGNILFLVYFISP